MACQSRYDQSIGEACAGTPGVTKIFIGNYSDLTSFALDTAGTTVTGITMSGTTKLYKVVLNQEVGSFEDSGVFDIKNKSVVTKPKVSFKVSSLSSSIITMYNKLIKVRVFIVIKGLDGVYYAVGFNNGLDCSMSKIGSEADANGFMGAQFEFDGLEFVTFYRLNIANFETTYTI